MNFNRTGKPGTFTEEEFTMLVGLCANYGETLLASKVAKISSKYATVYLHENPQSLVGKAFQAIATAITGNLGTNLNKPISREGFNSLSNLVGTYGAEVVVRKLGKIAARRAKELREAGNTTQATTLKASADSLKSIFPAAA